MFYFGPREEPDRDQSPTTALELDRLEWTRSHDLHNLLVEAARHDAVLVLLGSPEARGDALEAGRKVVAATARLAHAHLARVLATGEWEGRPFQLVEDLRETRSLASLIATRGPAHWQEAAELGRALAGALATLHGAGLVHGGLSLEGVFLDRDWRPKLALDARLLAFEGERGRVAPWPYRAPEDRDGTSVRGNLYSFGAILFALLGGRAALPGAPRPRAIVEDVPEALDRLVLELLARDPEQRPESADEVLTRLDPGRL